MTDAFANRLRKNLAHRGKWARRRGISCYRIYDRDVPQFPFAIDWYETVSPRAETHLHVQEIDTGWKMTDAEYTAWLVAVCDAICEVCAVPRRSCTSSAANGSAAPRNTKSATTPSPSHSW